MDIWHTPSRTRWFQIPEWTRPPAGGHPVQRAGMGDVCHVDPCFLDDYEVAPAYARQVLNTRIAEAIHANQRPVFHLHRIRTGS